jgi:phage-related baseplate assembly protein
VFRVKETTAVAANEAYIDIACEAVDAGSAANGFAISQVNRLIDTVAGLAVASVANTTATAGGAEAEDDEGLRARIKLAPDSFSVAGPFGAYRYWAYTAHPSVIDVAVTSPVPGTVNVYPLTDMGGPAPAVVSAVQTALSDESRRPLNDLVQVLAPTQVNYAVTVQLVVYADVDQVAVRNAAQAAVEAYEAARLAKLGRDIVPLQVARAAMVPGVYKANVISPVADQVLAANEWAKATSITVTVSGSVPG